jgi:hypothetical protein
MDPQHSRTRERDRMMRKESFSLSELHLSFEEYSIAMRFEQRPSLVDAASEPPVGVLLTAS